MSAPVVRLGGKDRLTPLPPGEPIDVEDVQNLVGDLTFEDSSNAPITLTQILAAALPGESRLTGLRNQGAGKLSIFSPTTVRIAAGPDEKLIERLPAATSVEHAVNWVQTDIVVAGIANLASFYVIEDVGFTGTGAAIELSSFPSAATLRANSWLFLGTSIHLGGVVIGVFDSPDLHDDQGFLLQSFLDLLGGTQRKSGNMVEIPASFTMQTETTVLFGQGINFHTDPLNPHDLTLAASPGAVTFTTIDGDGAVFNTGVSAFPKTWDNLGVETALTGKRAAVHQVAVLPDGDILVQLGTTNYKDYQEAVQAIGLEQLVNPLWIVADALGGTYGVCVIAADATVWADGFAHLLPLAEGGSSSGGGVTALLGLSDTPNTFIGGDSQVLVVNNAEDGTRFGKIRAQLPIPVVGNVDASLGAVLDVAMPLHINGFRFIADNVHLEVKTAPTGIDLEVDLRIAGSSIFGGTLPKILTSATVGQLAPVTVDHFQGDRVRVDINDGDATWLDLTVTLEGWIEPE